MLIDKKICGCDMKPKNCGFKTEFVSCSFTSTSCFRANILNGQTENENEATDNRRRRMPLILFNQISFSLKYFVLKL